ncbi:MAG: DUF6263 family protein [Hyphomicrobiales bacterium]
MKLNKIAKVLSVLFIFTLIVSSSAFAGKKTKLLLNPEINKAVKYELKMVVGTLSTVNGQVSAMDQNLTLDMEMNCKEKNADGNFVMSVIINDIDMEMDANGQSINYSSKLKAEELSPMAAQMKPMIDKFLGKPVEFVISPEGKVISIDSDDSNGAMGMPFQSKSQLEGLFNYLTAKEVKKGDTYKVDYTESNQIELLIKGEYTVEKIGSKDVDLLFKADTYTDDSEKKAGIMNNKLSVDRNTGMIKTSKTNWQYEAIVKQAGMEIPVDVEMEMTMTQK